MVSDQLGSSEMVGAGWISVMRGSGKGAHQDWWCLAGKPWQLSSQLQAVAALREWIGGGENPPY